MPLTQKAKEILAQIHILNPDSKYIFIRSGQPLATVTFNRHLKKCCEALGIEYRSSHKLRFSTASIMYKNGVEDTELQRLLGHTSLTMTHHYRKRQASANKKNRKRKTPEPLIYKDSEAFQTEATTRFELKSPLRNRIERRFLGTLILVAPNLHQITAHYLNTFWVIIFSIWYISLFFCT